MPDIWMDVDTALTGVPVNLVPLVDDTDFKTIEEGIAYNAAGMDLIWNFITTGGTMTGINVTPTTSGDYDWAHQDGGMYKIEIPASGGISANNDTEGFGWFTGKCDGVLAWRGPMIGFRSADHNNAFTDGTLAAFLNKIADHVIRRAFQNACDSSDGDTKTGRSLLGAIAKLVNKVMSSGGTLTIYEDDDITSLFTQAITTNASADPITELDTS